MIRADLAASALGLDGTGIVVANLDSGVDWQHPALLMKYRGYRGHAPAVHYGNWHVSTGEPYLYPGDGDGHGTHTMGTMVGDDGVGNRVGVAPGARWIAVKLFDNGGVTYESWIHDAFQWVMAPEGDASLAPDVINNSWGNDVGSDTRFGNDIKALQRGRNSTCLRGGQPRAGLWDDRQSRQLCRGAGGRGARFRRRSCLVLWPWPKCLGQHQTRRRRAGGEGALDIWRRRLVPGHGYQHGSAARRWIGSPPPTSIPTALGRSARLDPAKYCATPGR